MQSYKDIAKANKDAGTGEPQTPEFVKLDTRGQTLVGRLLAMDEVKASQGEGHFNMYIFDTDEGRIKTKFGGASDKEWGNQLEIGSIYQIKFLGQDPLSGGLKVNRFECLRLIENPPPAESK